MRLPQLSDSRAKGKTCKSGGGKDVRGMNHVQMTAKLYDARDTCKRLDRERYQEIMQPWIHIVGKVSKAKNISALEAAIELSKTEIAGSNATSILRLLAAAVEITEPTTKECA